MGPSTVYYYFIDTFNYYLQATVDPPLTMPDDSAQEKTETRNSKLLLNPQNIRASLSVKSSNKVYVDPLHTFQSVLNVGR